jgi:hypothetical protein
VTDPGSFFGSGQWIPVAFGVVIALGVHVLKATARPVVNATTAGLGAPVVSTVEDIGSAVMSVIAIILPILVLLFLVAIGLFAVWAVRRRGRAAAPS